MALSIAQLVPDYHIEISGLKGLCIKDDLGAIQIGKHVCPIRQAIHLNNVALVNMWLDLVKTHGVCIPESKVLWEAVKFDRVDIFACLIAAGFQDPELKSYIFSTDADKCLRCLMDMDKLDLIYPKNAHAIHDFYRDLDELADLNSNRCWFVLQDCINMYGLSVFPQYA